MVAAMVDAADWVLEAEGLAKQFGSKLAVDGLSLRFARGEIVGLLGPNGAGKTTTLKILLGMLRPTRGRASVLGLDCTSQAIAIKQRVGSLTLADVGLVEIIWDADNRDIHTSSGSLK